MSLIQPIKSTQTIAKSKYKKKYIYKKCNDCNKKRGTLDESHQICHVCYNMKKVQAIHKSGNKIIDDFIRHTQINYVKKEGKMEFVPYDQFKNVEFIAEGGFSKIYKAIWIDGPISQWNYKSCSRKPNYEVVLKKLNNSKKITSKELNELQVFYDYLLKWKTQNVKNWKNWGRKSSGHEYREYYSSNNVSEYFGITQDLITQDIMIIMPYYSTGDLVHYITQNFYSFDWYNKLNRLKLIINGLVNIHDANIIHRDLHSGNIFFKDSYYVFIGDLGISKSATESTTDDNNNENYGIIPYMAPEIFQGQKYTKASDIYSFGMIMWEFMTGRRPFWDKNHDIDLIIKICDGERPPIVTNAPEGYIELMKECWNSDPDKRPSAIDAYNKIDEMWNNEQKHYDRNKIIKSPDIGPVTINNPGAIYKSRPLSGMIQSAMSTRSLRSQSINLETDLFHHYQKSHMSFYDKRKFDNNQIKNSLINGKSIKKIKLVENENNDYTTKELEFDVDTDFKQDKNDHEYTTQEIHFDINTF